MTTGAPPMDAAESDLLAGIDTNRPGASDDFADFLRPVDEVGIDESSAVRLDPTTDGNSVDEGDGR